MFSSTEWPAPSRGLGLTCLVRTGTDGTSNGDPIRGTFAILAVAASGAGKSVGTPASVCRTIAGMTSVGLTARLVDLPLARLGQYLKGRNHA